MERERAPAREDRTRKALFRQVFLSYTAIPDLNPYSRDLEGEERRFPGGKDAKE